MSDIPQMARPRKSSASAHPPSLSLERRDPLLAA